MKAALVVISLLLCLPGRSDAQTNAAGATPPAPTATKAVTQPPAPAIAGQPKEITPPSVALPTPSEPANAESSKTPAAAAEASTTGPDTMTARSLSGLTLEQLAGRPDVIDAGKVRISGPLVRPMKAQRLREVPRRLFQAINPFAPPEENDEWSGLPRVSTHAWTTTVGWHPGASAFADPVSHESTLGLVTIGRSSPP